MPQLHTVLTVVAPRDFDACLAEARAFLDTFLLDAYLGRAVPRWLPYVSGFRPVYLARAAQERAAQTLPLKARSHGRPRFRHSAQAEQLASAVSRSMRAASPVWRSLKPPSRSRARAWWW
jgi:hypothetical protein